MKLPPRFGSVSKLSGNRRRPWIARVTSDILPTLSRESQNSIDRLLDTIPPKRKRFRRWQTSTTTHTARKRRRLLSANAMRKRQRIFPRTGFTTTDPALAIWNRSWISRSGPSAPPSSRSVSTHVRPHSSGRLRRSAERPTNTP